MEVVIKAGKVSLAGDLVVPRGAKGVVIFVHGSGSSRFSPRNRFVAKQFNAKNIATLLMDILTEKEERIDEVTGELRFDIELLAQRVSYVISWWNTQHTLPIGLFGASTGAAAAKTGNYQICFYLEDRTSAGLSTGPGLVKVIYNEAVVADTKLGDFREGCL